MVDHSSLHLFCQNKYESNIVLVTDLLISIAAKINEVKLSPKYFNIRWTLFTAPLAAMALSVLIWFLAREYFTSRDELNKATFIIDSMHFTTYTEDRALGPDKTYRYFDITTREQYTIRLNDVLGEDKRDVIFANYSAGDTIEVLYTEHLMQGNLLSNPEEITINGHTIMSLEDNKRIILYLLTGVTIVVLLFLLVFVMAHRTYTKHLVKGDRIAAQKSKWKLIWRWLSE